MKARRKLKQRPLPSSVIKTNDLEKKTRKAMQEANERIKSVSRKYKGTTYMWAVNKLKSKVGGRFFKNNRIVIPKNVKGNELLKVYKEIESFLSSKESTKTGIKQVQEKAKQTIKTDLFTGEVTQDDIDVYYSMLEDKDFTSMLDSDFSASEFWVVLDDTKEANDTLDEFQERLSYYKDIKDETLRQKAINLYNKYIR